MSDKGAGAFFGFGLLVWIPILLVGATCFADQDPTPYSYVTHSLDRKHTFVMIAPKAWGSDELLWNGNRYSASGLYRSDGSTTPLWTVDWYAYHVVVADNGSHVIRFGPWAAGPFEEALTFVDRGQILKSYKIRDLVLIPLSLPHSVSHLQWHYKNQIDTNRGTFSVVTANGEHHTFDLSNGRILTSFHLRPWAIGVGAGLIIAVLVFVSRRRGVPFHVVAMTVASFVWSAILVFSNGHTSTLEMGGGLATAAAMTGVSGLALLPAGFVWIIKREYLRCSMTIMWMFWGLAAIASVGAMMVLSFGSIDAPRDIYPDPHSLTEPMPR